MTAARRRSETGAVAASAAYVPEPRSLLGRGARKLLRDKGGVFGLSVTLALVLVALSAPVIAPYDPLEIGADIPLAAPSIVHPFGTDELGRDVLSRIIFGAQISVSVAFLSGFASLLTGVPLGLVAAFRRGKVDAAISSLFDTIFAFPAVLLGIALVALLGSGIPNVVVAVAIINIPQVGRLTRVAVQTQLAQEYVEAARATGATGLQIAARHILPNIVPLLLVQTTVTMAGAVLLEAAFSFLGLGSRPPTPSWGSMLDGGRAFLAAAPWLGIFPGLAISAMVLALNSLGDALQAALDPRRP